MANAAKEETTSPAYDPEELVDFMIPRSGPNDRAEFIGVNGESIRVSPGVPVKIKRKFIEAWEHAKEQEHAAWRAQMRAQSAARKPLAEL